MLDLSFKGLLLFSLPSIFSSLLEPISGVVDTALVGQLNTNWLAALAISSIIFNSFTWMFNFLIHASTQAIASSTSLKDKSLLNERIRISLTLCLIVGLASTILLYFIRIPLYRFSGASEGLIPIIEAYFIVRLLGQPFTLLYSTSISILRGLERVKASFYLILLTTTLNIFVSWYLLFVLNWGIEGAAYGTILSNIVGFLIVLVLILKDPQVDFDLLKKTSNKSSWLQFGSNSRDIFIRSAALTFCFYLSTKLAGSLGIISLAAHQVLMQIWLICSFFVDGLAITGNVLGSKLTSEKEEDQLSLLCKNLLLLGFGIGLLFTFIYSLGGDFIWSLFTKDKEVLNLIGELWPLIFLSQSIMAIAYVYDGLLFGMGEFAFLRKNMLIGTVFVFLSLVTSLVFWKNLWPLWLGLVCLGIYRAISCFRKVRKVLRDVQYA